MNEDREIESIKSDIMRRFQGECKKQNLYISSYKPLMANDGISSISCFVEAEATEFAFKIIEEESEKTVKKVEITAKVLNEYCNDGEDTPYISLNDVGESISDSFTIKFQDRHWRQPEDISWTVFSCSEAQRIISKIQAEKARIEKEQAEQQLLEAEKLQKEQKEREKKLLQEEALKALITRCEGHIYTLSTEGSLRHLYKIVDRPDNIVITYRDIPNGVQIAIDVKQESLCNMVQNYGSTYMALPCPLFLSPFIIVDMRKNINGYWEARDSQKSIRSFRPIGCWEASQIISRSR